MQVWKVTIISLLFNCYPEVLKDLVKFSTDGKAICGFFVTLTHTQTSRHCRVFPVPQKRWASPCSSSSERIVTSWVCWYFIANYKLWHVCMCVLMCPCAWVNVCVGRWDLTFRCLPVALHLTYHTELGTHWLSRSIEPVCLGNSSVSSPQSCGIIGGPPHPPGIYICAKGAKLGSLCLISKHFTHWAISLGYFYLILRPISLRYK